MGKGMQVSHEETKEAILKAGILQNICGTDCSAASDCSGGISAYFRKKYKEQAVENIESVQTTVAAGLLSDADFMSMRLSQITNVNNNMIMQYAVDLDNGNDADSSKE